MVVYLHHNQITDRAGSRNKNNSNMKKYILVKTQKGSKYLYQVKDEQGNVVAKRTSTRDYVACTSNGEFYFGRVDLIGKGDHGRQLNQIYKLINDPRGLYEDIARIFVPSYRSVWKKENPFDEWYNSKDMEYWKDRKTKLENIAYLQSGE